VLRIIGGAWRSRRFRFPDGATIRPTPDRVRETLFNWLGSSLRGARCLDLYAGSGALGLEALSRGAAEAVFVERERIAAEAIRARLQEWGAQGAEVLAMDAQRYLALDARPFDVVFLDPPFALGAAPGALRALLERGWLAPGARIYVEFAAREPPELPAGLTRLKQGRSGEVGYDLLTYGSGGSGGL
jgi:16S rRNA (guanine966-N2)-methyltransferase